MIGGRASVAWGEPCCAACATANPPDDAAGELAAVVGLYDFLGEAVAWGALASKLGMPAGADLVARAASFVVDSATLGEAETGSVLGVAESAIAAAERSAPKAWAKIEAAASRTLAALSKGKALVAIGVGGLLASQWISADDKRKLSALASDKTLLGENLARLSGPELAAVLKELAGMGPAGAGIFGGLGDVLPWVVGGIALWFGLPFVLGLFGRGGR